MKLNEVKQLPLFPDIHIEPINWDEINIGQPSEDVHQVAQANLMGDAYDIHPVKLYPLSELLGPIGKDYYSSAKGEPQRVKDLVEQIRQNKRFSPIIIAQMDVEGEDDEMWIVEGQHRARAIEMTNTKTIPAILIEYYETE